MKLPSAAVKMNDGKLAPLPPKVPYVVEPGYIASVGRDVYGMYGPACDCVSAFCRPTKQGEIPPGQYFVMNGVSTVSRVAGCANAAMRGSDSDASTSTKVADSRWSSRPWKLFDQGLL